MTAVQDHATTGHTISANGASPAEKAKDRRVLAILIGLAVLGLLAITAYLTYGVQGSWSYALSLRSRQVGSLIVVGIAIGASSLVFQTIAGSRILTPGVMGFDAVYVLIQTMIVGLFGASTLQLLGVMERFALNTFALMIFGLLLFRFLFRSNSRNLFVVVLVGIVLGSLFASLSTLTSRLLSPDDFLTLQTVLFASFTTVDPVLLGVTGAATAFGLLALWPQLRKLDVVDLGHDGCVALGVDYHRTVRTTLVIVTLLVAASTALVGPMIFLGLIVANLARQALPTHRHTSLVVASALIGLLFTVGGQFLVTHVFDLQTPISVVINLVGGLYFIVLLLRTDRL